MAVITYLNGGNLNTALNAYASAASNLGTYGNVLQLANTRTIAFTPTVETIQGCVLAILWNAQATTNITVKLQENIAGTWTDVAGATKTLNGTQVTSGLVNLLPINNTNMQCGVYFAFPTPKLVTAVANTWRFDVTVSSVSGGNPYLYTSDNTNPFYVAVGSTPVTYTDNTDQPVIVNNPVAVTASAQFASILSTGNTTRGTCGFLGTSANGDGENTAMLTCDTNSVSITTKGYFVMSSWSAPRFGTDAVPLSGFTLNYHSSNTGTARNTGFTTYRADADGSSNLSKVGFFLHGTMPAYEDTYLIKPALVGDTTITVADSTAWALNDRIYVGGQTTRGIADTTAYTVSSVIANVITLSSAIVGATRNVGPSCTISIATPGVVTTTRKHGLVVGDEIYFSTTGALPTGITSLQKYYVVSIPTLSTFQFSATQGGAPVNTSGTQSGTHTLGVAKYAARVIRMNGYGAVFQSNVAGGVYNYLGQPSNHVITGCQIRDIGFVHSTNGGRENDYVGYSYPYRFQHCSYENTSSPTSGSGFLTALINNYTGTYIEHVNSARAALFGSMAQTAGSSFYVRLYDCINIHGGFTSGSGYNVGTSAMQLDFQRNHFEHSNLQMTFMFSASTFNNNRFWGCSTTIGWFRINAGVGSTFYRNIFDNSANAYSFVSTTVDCNAYQDIFGPTIANGYDMNFLAGFTEFQEIAPLTDIVLDTGSPITGTIQGSLLRIGEYGGNPNDNATYGRFGSTQSCGSGLADTTARTPGGLSLKLSPNNAINPWTYPQKVSERSVPTGNIQNKVVTISGYVRIEKAAYAAGSHTKPTLNVRYDNGTVASTVAAAFYADTDPETDPTKKGWQRISVTFTPATTYGQIDVWWSSATDATGVNRNWYLDDMNIGYPAGVVINLGGLDTYSKGLPDWPPVAFINSTNSFDVQTSTALPGTYGELAKDTAIKTDDASLLRGVIR